MSKTDDNLIRRGVIHRCTNGKSLNLSCSTPVGVLSFYMIVVDLENLTYIIPFILLSINRSFSMVFIF